MKKRSIIVLTLLAGCFTNSFAQKGEKTLTVEVSNEWTQNKTDEPIVIDLNNLKAGFNIKSATVWEGNKEIPSQLDDLMLKPAFRLFKSITTGSVGLILSPFITDFYGQCLFAFLCKRVGKASC